MLKAINKSNRDVFAIVAEYIGTTNSVRECLTLWDAYIRDEDYRHSTLHVIDLKRSLVLVGVVHDPESSLRTETVPMDSFLMVVCSRDKEGRVRFDYSVSVTDKYTDTWEVEGEYLGL